MISPARSYWISWWRAFRLFSLTGALVPTLLGVTLAWRDGPISWLDAGLVVVAGCLIQGGCNLVNDFFEYKQGILPEKNPDLGIFGQPRTALERLIYATGAAMFVAAVPIGLYLVTKTGLPLLAIGAAGLVGGYSYTGPPFTYKNRALGVVLVFFLMGALMVAGSYFALRGAFTPTSWLASIPIGFLISLLLISNEIRDAEDDRERNLRTLTYRIGLASARRLYWAVLAAACVSLIALMATGAVAWTCALAFLALPLAWRILPHLHAPQGGRRRAVFLTARLHLWFGLLYAAGLVIGSRHP